MNFRQKCAVTLVLSGLLAVSPAIADKPSWAGSGKGGHERQAERRDKGRHDDRASRRDTRSVSAAQRGHFEERHRDVAREYYAHNHRGHDCPPGLAKKRNGCMPPGQAKKWRVGRALPREVIFYEVPRPLVLEIGPPPSGYRYVRVASDILMIAIGTGIVVDAIQNLTR